MHVLHDVPILGDHFSVAPAAHKPSIGRYFFEVVILQTLNGFKKWFLETVLRILSEYATQD